MLSDPFCDCHHSQPNRTNTRDNFKIERRIDNLWKSVNIGLRAKALITDTVRNKCLALH